ncbi:MAG: arginine--tRNA ligase [Methylophilaceae bacterium]|nr:arginine--tRNA ligase [Methylophilaceae bacterium]
MKDHLTDLLFNAVKQLTDELDQNQIVIERPKLIEHGDFSTNIALVLSKILKKTPRDIAQLILDKLPETTHFDKIEIAGAGFLNFFLSPFSHQAIINQVIEEKDNYGGNKKGKSRKVQIEFVSANPTGPLHVGHGRGAAIGDSIARLFEFSGWSVTREFYYNDAGAQIDNLMHSVKAHCLNIKPDHKDFPENGYRGSYIADIAKDYLAKTSIQCAGHKIQASGDINDEDSIRIFSIAYLRNEQDKDLEAFQTTFNVYTLESDLYKNHQVDFVVNTLIKEGHTYEKDGALWLRTTDFGDDKDRVMKKSDGDFTYFVPDVAYHLDKWTRGFIKVINEQGADHHSTISRVRAGLQGLNKNIPKDWPEYVLHQMITVMKNGAEVKISKRAGSYVTLKDLIDEVGCDATRYFLAARRADSQLIFDIDLAKSQSNDNPVYYIQYAHARIEGVLNQWKGDRNKLWIDTMPSFETQAEKKLIKRISEFPEVVILATDELAPHQITNFLKDCAADLHSYYNDSKFLVDDELTKITRLALIYATQCVIKNGLALLGITAPKKM